jgi:GTP-binding protein HflX
VQRRKRLTVPVPSVAIIGYTNVGKSSLLNRLMEEGARSPIYADDKLFATLDPTSRRVRMPQGGWAVFTDTVGFISRLPTTLVAAFRSTLEEVLEADCLLLVEDCSAPDLEEQRRTVASVLDDLGAGRIPCVAVLNKADLLSTGQRKPLEGDGARPLVSALTGEGTGAMLSRVQEVLNSRWLLRELSVDAADGRFIGEIHRNSQVVSRKTAGDRLVLSLRVTQENWRRILRLMNPGG